MKQNVPTWTIFRRDLLSHSIGQAIQEWIHAQHLKIALRAIFASRAAIGGFVERFMWRIGPKMSIKEFKKISKEKNDPGFFLSRAVAVVMKITVARRAKNARSAFFNYLGTCVAGSKKHWEVVDS